MALQTTHPEYDCYICDWTTIRDAYRGERHVKALYDKYLPPTTGMCPNWMPRTINNHFENNINQCWEGPPPGMNTEQMGRYLTYIMRAEFPDSMSSMVDTALGILWNKDATIELPKQLEYLRLHATSANESLQDFMMRVNIEQLGVQRCGLLVEMNSEEKLGPPTPYLSLYCAESIINWDDLSSNGEYHSNLNLVVINESGNQRLQMEGQDFFVRTWVQQYRVLSLNTGVYQWGVFPKDGYNAELMNTAKIRQQPLPFIPFYFINGMTGLPCVEKPRALALADKIFSAYRTSADYEMQLHEQAQETLVLEGGDPKTKYAIGSGAVLTPTPGSGQAAYFIGLNGKGLPEQRSALQNKLTQILQMSGQLIDTRSLQRESGEALATRIASSTATLSSIATTCGKVITRALRDLATALGADPDEVNIKPNTNFISPELFAKTLVELQTAKNLGFPITEKDEHRLAQERGISTEEYTDTQEELAAENPIQVVTGNPIGNPSGNAPKVIAPPTPPGGAGGAGNPTGLSPRGKTRNAATANRNKK